MKTCIADLKAKQMSVLSGLIDIITSRRSIRRFLDQPVPPELIEAVLEAARWAPSAHNRQPWRFVVITESASRQQLARDMANKLEADSRLDGKAESAIQADSTRSYQRLTSAPVHILVCLSMEEMDRYPDRPRKRAELRMAIQSTAMASQNLLLAAHAAELGACWMCAPLFCPQIVCESLQLPADYEPQGLIVMGYVAESRSRVRKPLESLVIYR
jgi:F420 biosynthesis protein FbiB-like protein